MMGCRWGLGGLDGCIGVWERVDLFLRVYASTPLRAIGCVETFGTNLYTIQTLSKNFLLGFEHPLKLFNVALRQGPTPTTRLPINGNFLDNPQGFWNCIISTTVSSMRFERSSESSQITCGCLISRSANQNTT